jgi:NAD(P)-dependent dehydrogenase (short-subunit alcohol dehydrogenase family)
MILQRFSLEGLSALVTGGGGGLGSACAIALAEAGADVALLDLDRSKLAAPAKAIAAVGRKAHLLVADVAEETSVSAAARDVTAAFGKIDILLNSAGIILPKHLIATTPHEWQRVIDVNLTGAYMCTRAFAPDMIERRCGRIINMGSILSGRGLAGRAAYCASKAGLANLGAALAFELGPYGITVNTIGPTATITDLNRDLVQSQPQLYEGVLRRSALGRLGEPDDITGLVVFLASPAARFITGQTIFVDGGYTAC